MLGLLYYCTSPTRYTQGSAALFIGVVSSWFFDFLVHREDLPISPIDGTLPPPPNTHSISFSLSSKSLSPSSVSLSLSLLSFSRSHTLFYTTDTMFGWSLWDSRFSTLLIDVLTFMAGGILYYSCTVPKNLKGFHGFNILMALVLFYYFGSLGASLYLQTQQEADMWVNCQGGMAVFCVLWALWVDSNRGVVWVKSKKD